MLIRIKITTAIIYDSNDFDDSDDSNGSDDSGEEWIDDMKLNVLTENNFWKCVLEGAILKMYNGCLSSQ